MEYHQFLYSLINEVYENDLNRLDTAIPIQLIFMSQHRTKLFELNPQLVALLNPLLPKLPPTIFWPDLPKHKDNINTIRKLYHLLSQSENPEEMVAPLSETQFRDVSSRREELSEQIDGMTESNRVDLLWKLLHQEYFDFTIAISDPKADLTQLINYLQEPSSKTAKAYFSISFEQRRNAHLMLSSFPLLYYSYWYAEWSSNLLKKKEDKEKGSEPEDKKEDGEKEKDGKGSLSFEVVAGAPVRRETPLLRLALIDQIDTPFLLFSKLQKIAPFSTPSCFLYPNYSSLHLFTLCRARTLPSFSYLLTGRVLSKKDLQALFSNYALLKEYALGQKILSNIGDFIVVYQKGCLDGELTVRTPPRDSLLKSDAFIILNLMLEGMVMVDSFVVERSHSYYFYFNRYGRCLVSKFMSSFNTSSPEVTETVLHLFDRHLSISKEKERIKTERPVWNLLTKYQKSIIPGMGSNFELAIPMKSWFSVDQTWFRRDCVDSASIRKVIRQGYLNLLELLLDWGLQADSKIGIANYFSHSNIFQPTVLKLILESGSPEQLQLLLRRCDLSQSTSILEQIRLGRNFFERWSRNSSQDPIYQLLAVFFDCKSARPARPWLLKAIRIESGDYSGLEVALREHQTWCGDLRMVLGNPIECSQYSYPKLKMLMRLFHLSPSEIWTQVTEIKFIANPGLNAKLDKLLHLFLQEHRTELIQSDGPEQYISKLYPLLKCDAMKSMIWLLQQVKEKFEKESVRSEITHVLFDFFVETHTQLMIRDKERIEHYVEILFDLDLIDLNYSAKLSWIVADKLFGYIESLRKGYVKVSLFVLICRCIINRRGSAIHYSGELSRFQYAPDNDLKKITFPPHVLIRRLVEAGAELNPSKDSSEPVIEPLAISLGYMFGNIDTEESGSMLPDRSPFELLLQLGAKLQIRSPIWEINVVPPNISVAARILLEYPTKFGWRSNAFYSNAEPLHHLLEVCKRYGANLLSELVETAPFTPAYSGLDAWIEKIQGISGEVQLYHTIEVTEYLISQGIPARHPDSLIRFLHSIFGLKVTNKQVVWELPSRRPLSYKYLQYLRFSGLRVTGSMVDRISDIIEYLLSGDIEVNHYLETVDADNSAIIQAGTALHYLAFFLRCHCTDSSDTIYSRFNECNPEQRQILTEGMKRWCRLLIKQGADPNLKQSDGQSVTEMLARDAIEFETKSLFA